MLEKRSFGRFSTQDEVRISKLLSALLDQSNYNRQLSEAIRLCRDGHEPEEAMVAAVSRFPGKDFTSEWLSDRLRENGMNWVTPRKAYAWFRRTLYSRWYRERLSKGHISFKCETQGGRWNLAVMGVEDKLREQAPLCQRCLRYHPKADECPTPSLRLCQRCLLKLPENHACKYGPSRGR